MKPIKILFVCVHNSARSQMAEAFINYYGKGDIIAESAGLEKGTLNPLVVEAMNEIGIDISNNTVDSVFDFYKSGKLFSYVVTVCDSVNGQKCPIFPGARDMINWSFEDPSLFEGSHEERLQRTKQVREQIKNQVLEFIELLKERYNFK